MLLDDTGSIFYFISGVMLLEKLSIHISPPTKLMDAKPLAYRGYLLDLLYRKTKVGSTIQLTDRQEASRQLFFFFWHFRSAPTFSRTK